MAVQIPFREEMDEIRSKLWAESAARVFETAVDEQLEFVNADGAKRAAAFAVLRRKFDALTREYFGRRSPWGTPEASDRDWTQHGPKKHFDAAYRRFFPPLALVNIAPLVAKAEGHA